MKALNPRSLFGSIFNLVVGLVLALSAAVFAFKAVPVTRLGAARPEAAWAFFWGRATALVVLSEGDFILGGSGSFRLRNGGVTTRVPILFSSEAKLSKN